MSNSQHHSPKKMSKKGGKVVKKTEISLFYLFKRFPLLSLIHYGFAFFSAYGSVNLILGKLGDMLKKGDVGELRSDISILLIRLLIYGITVYLHILVGNYLEELYTTHLRKKLTKKFLSANFTQAQKEEFALSRFDSDAAIVGQKAVQIFNRTFYCVCSMVLLLWGISKNSEEKWALPWCLGALAILAVLVPVLYYISYRYKLKRDRGFEKENKRFKELRDNIEYIKTTGNESKEFKQSSRQFTNNLRKNYAFIAIKSIYATIPSYILVRVIPLFFLVIGGNISGAILYAKLADTFGNCKTIFELFWAYGGYESYSSSRKRLNESFAILEKNAEFPAKTSEKMPLPTKPAVKFQNVNFAYPETNQKILDNFSFNFQSGKKCVIIGPNGVGKSTLFKLIVKLYKPQYGVIKLNDNELEKIDNSTLREKIIYLPNNPSFFNTSLGNNIVYPEVYQEGIHKEKLEQITKKLGIKEFIDQLPNRWETVIAERGQNLSEGQKQLVSLMRALVRDYEIYLFDEFLSNVNNELKVKIVKFIFQELREKIIIIISHDGETIKYVDEVYKFTSHRLIKET